MDFVAEYEDMVASVPNHVAVTYKFFNLFTSKKGTSRTLEWASQSSRTLTDEEWDALRGFLRRARTDLRETPERMTAAECARRMWFWGQKLHELAVFEPSILRDIVAWMELVQYIVA